MKGRKKEGRSRRRERKKEKEQECQQSDKVIVLCTHLESTEAKPLLREAFDKLLMVFAKNQSAKNRKLRKQNYGFYCKQ